VKRPALIIGGIAGVCLVLAGATPAQRRVQSRSRPARAAVRQIRVNNRRGVVPISATARNALRAGIVGQIVVAQLPSPHRFGARPAARPPQVAVDPVALELLQKVFHHTLDYVGIQRTQAGAQSSEQKVEEDTRGHIRYEYIAPAEFQGDIVLAAPNNFYHYHARENRTDVAYWPISKEVKDRAVINMIRRGLVTLAITGQETIAGRDCAILTLSWQRPRAQAETQRRLWVDTASGIVVRREDWNASGQLSASYMTSITVGPEAGVMLKDFAPAQLPKNARQEAVYPRDTPTCATIAQAEALAGFHILAPGQLPANYTLDGIWVFGRGRNASVLLRYTVGVNHFNLFERPAYNPTPQQLNRPYRRAGANLQRWLATLPNGGYFHILYIGHLSPDEVQAIHDSLR
jgi:hypothetical protein